MSYETKKVPENAHKTAKTHSSERQSQTKKQLFFEIFRFLIVGGTATLVDYAISYLFYKWLLPPPLIGDGWSLFISTALGFCVGLVINWLLSVTFVFRQVSDKKASKSGKSFVIFTVIGVVGLGITELGMHFGVKILPEIILFGSATVFGVEWAWWICKVVMTCLVLIWNYCGRKIFIFK